MRAGVLKNQMELWKYNRMNDDDDILSIPVVPV